MPQPNTATTNATQTTRQPSRSAVEVTAAAAIARPVVAESGIQAFHTSRPHRRFPVAHEGTEPRRRPAPVASVPVSASSHGRDRVRQDARAVRSQLDVPRQAQALPRHRHEAPVPSMHAEYRPNSGVRGPTVPAWRWLPSPSWQASRLPRVSWRSCRSTTVRSWRPSAASGMHRAAPTRAAKPPRSAGTGALRFAAADRPRGRHRPAHSARRWREKGAVSRG